MRKLNILALLVTLSLSNLNADSSEHTFTGTSYGQQGIDTYAQMRHGPDGALFLDPYITHYLSDLGGMVVLDAGCGAGPWSIVAAQNGAEVWGVDIQEGMITKAIQAAAECKVDTITHFTVGDVGDLPYPEELFDRVFSINVGCNLPNLKPHIEELSRVLKEGGIAVITAPNSFGKLFTADGNIVKLFVALQDENPKSAVQKLDAVYRATFVEKEGRWNPVFNENELTAGEVIWRKIPKMIVPNFYHSSIEYRSLLEETGFQIVTVFEPKFNSEAEWKLYNKTNSAKLGKEYMDNSPFVIFIAQKRIGE